MMDKKKTDKKKTVASYKAGGSVFKMCPSCKTKRACSIAKKCMKKVYG
jgi:hypothetical protein